MSSPTIETYAETNALYAVMCNNPDGATAIVSDFLNEELGQFLQQIMTLHEIVVTEMSGRAPTRTRRNGH